MSDHGAVPASTGDLATAPEPARRSRRTALLLAAYPLSFRERYGDELAALLHDTGVGPRDVVDLLLGALRAWLRPSYGAAPAEARRLRLLSSVSTVWVGFCVVLCGTYGVLTFLEDRPPPRLSLGTERWQYFHLAATFALALALVLVLVGGAPLVVRVLLGGSADRRAVAGPVVALALLVLGTPALLAADTRIPVSSGWSVLPLWFLVPGVVWLVSIPTVAAWWAVALPRALRMARPRSADLVVSALLAVLVALLMTAPVLLVAAVGYRSVRLWGFGGEAVVVGVCVAGLVTGWLVSVVSALRGLPAIWARDRRAPT